jgi:predicted P-loop ATPase
MTVDATWLQNAAMDARGNLVPNLANVLICLRGAMELNGCFGFNEMTETVELIEELPSSPGVNGASAGTLSRAVIDADVAQVCEWLQRAYDMRKIGLNVVHQAVDRRGRECRFHPLRDWLNDLIWDRVPCVRSLFSTYFGAEANKYTEEVSKIFLIGMIARAYTPGCQVDYVPILVGNQGC